MLADAASNLSTLFIHLEEYVKHRVEKSLELDTITPLPDIVIEPGEQYPLNNLILQYDLSDDEIIMLLTALTPHIHPGFFDGILDEYFPDLTEFFDFGGVKGKNQLGLLPTGTTALFLIAGNNDVDKLTKRDLLEHDSKLFELGLLRLGEVPYGEPRLSGLLILEHEYLHLVTTGQLIKPDLSPSFPASLINTELEWEDLVLKQDTLDEILELQTWLTHNNTLMEDWGMAGKIKPGYRVMFYGPPGTGKTMTASLLGKYTNRDVYRIDLSMVVSKYIGETEKNLSSLFNKAKNRDWILFFDEADAIFGKRTNVRDAHDKYANQEVSYLLQQIEAHPGLIILASNFKNNIDEAFTRRFNSIVEFETPDYEQRLELWQRSLPENAILGENISLEEFAAEFEITGANILNIIHYACLKQLETGSPTLEYEYLIDGVRREYTKEGRLISSM
ncbi:MAG: ATP-binding protein [Fluviicola sp.]